MTTGGVSVIASGITARGPEGVAFANVDARAEPGDILAACGPAGCGKTALLLALAGRLGLVAGHLEVGGHVLPARAKAVRRLVALGRVRPGCELTELLRVREVIAEQRIISGVTKRQLRDTCTRLGIDPAGSTLVVELEPDERLLLAVALATADGPAGIVVDDVDAGLPAAEQHRVWDALRVVSASGCTVLASAVDPPDHGVIPLPLDSGRPRETSR